MAGEAHGGTPGNATAAVEIESMRVTSYRPPWSEHPSEVHLVLYVTGGRKLSIRLRSGAVCEALIGALRERCDEVFGPDVTGLIDTQAEESS